MGTLKLNKNVVNIGALSLNTNEKPVAKRTAKKAENQVASDVNAESIELCELAKQDDGFVEELENLRTANETVYRRNDRTCRKIITSVPTRYLDTDGEFKNISNRLIDSGSEIVNEANSFKVKFDKDERSGKIFDLQRGKKKLTLSATGSAKARGHVCGCKCKLCAETDDTVTATLDDGTEIQYITLSDRIKENIIVKQRQESYEYNFTLNIGDMTVEEGEHNDLLLKDAQTGETEFIIPAPYMYDANKKRSDNVSYEIDVNGEELAIKVVADAEFINAKERAFPVIIDPQILTFTNGIYCKSIIYENLEDSKQYEMPGLETSQYGGSEWTVGYLTYTKPEIKGTVIKMYLVLHCFEGRGKINIGGTVYDLDTYPKLYDEGQDFYIDITDSITTRIVVRVSSQTGHATFETSGTNAPRIQVEYIPGEVSEDEFARDLKPLIKEYNLTDKAKGYLYLKDGSIAVSFNSVLASDFTLPICIKHIHKAGYGESVYGLDWRLNLDKKLIKDSSDTIGDTKYLYTDELGDVYEFSEKYYYYIGLYGSSDASDKNYITDKSKIKIDVAGNLTYDNYPVYTQYDCNGYTIIPHIEDFINSDLIEQRQDEEVQIEEYIAQVKPVLESYVIAEESENTNNLTCDITMREFTRDNHETYIEFIRRKYDALLSHINKADNSTSSPEYFMSKNEATQLQSLNISLRKIYASLKQLDDQFTNGDILEDSYRLQEASHFEQEYLLRQQIDELKANSINNLDQIKNAFINFIRRYEELELLKMQTPVNFVKDNEGIISGYNENGDLVFICDSFENYVSISYNSKNHITEITDNNGTSLKFEYNNGLLKSITDRRGRRVQYKYVLNSYNTKSKLDSIEFADGSSLTIGYSSGKVATVDSSNCLKTRLSYSTNKVERIINKAISPRKGDISTVNLTYYEDGVLLEESGNTEDYRFFTKGKIKQYVSKDNSKIGSDTTYSYETLDDVKRVTASTIYTDGKEKTVIDEYDFFNLLKSHVEDWQNVSETVKVKTQTLYEYDVKENLVKETATEYTDNSGLITEKVSVTKHSYNANGQLILTESYIEGEELTSGINFEEKVYNDSGNMLKCIRWNSLDSTTKFYEESDRAENGQVTSDRDETGEISAEYEYVSGTNVVNSVKYPNGSKFAYGRNPNNFAVTGITQSTEEGEANTTNIDYEYGLPVRVASGNTTLEYEYDHKGRKTSVKVNGVEQITATYKDYSVNADGSVVYSTETSKLNVDGKTVKIVYSKTGVPDANSATVQVTETLTVGNDTLYEKIFDGNGRLASVKNSGVTVTYTYDGYDNVTQVSGDGLTENYAYNEYGELTEKSLTGAVTQTYSYAYKDNAAHSLECIEFGGYRFKPLSDVNGRNTGREIYSGENKLAAEYITYRKVGDHATNMPACVWFGNGSQIKDSIKYKYDSCGNICEVTQNGHVVAKYTYDALNRLIREDNKLAGSTMVYTYDNAGNITERCEYPYTSKSGEELEELDCTHYSYDYDGDKLVSYDGEAFAYNSIGNPTVYRGKACEWQYGKQLTKFDETTFAYDGLGRRTQKNGITFTYDSDGRLIKQSDGLEFVYDNAGVVGVIYNGATYFYRKDAQGNIIAILDTSGKIVAKYIYDAWGNNIALDANGDIITDGIGLLNPFRYRGYYYDDETGLYYLQTRYYDPETGRFISQDSVEYADPETINGLNLCAYCRNNPIKYIDFMGNIPIANIITKVTLSRSFKGLYSQIWGRIGYTASITKQNKETGFFYLSETFGINDKIVSFGAGINAWGWYGVEFGLNMDYNLTVSGNITPWFHVGYELGLSGINITLGINIGDTSHDITFGIGLGLVTVAVAGAAVVFSGGTMIEPFFDILRRIFAF